MPTKIQWAEETWNPTVGCSKVSPGCKNCYAIRDAHRLAKHPNPKIHSVYSALTVNRKPSAPNWSGVVRLIPERLTQPGSPLRTKKPTRWFVNSMSDLFHEGLKDEEIDQVFAVMALCPQHVFMVLTKRAERMREYCKGIEMHPDEDPARMAPLTMPLSNVWLGVSAENQETSDERIPLLLQTPAAVRFVSYEPALGPVDFLRIANGGRLPGVNGPVSALSTHSHGERITSLDWIIAGAESGPKARPAELEWFRSVRNQCRMSPQVSFFLKQFATPNGKKIPLPELDGRTWDEFPESRG